MTSARSALVAPLLARVVDTAEKLDITLHLYRVRYGSRSAAMVANALAIPVEVARDALDALARAGILQIAPAGYWFDPTGRWASSVEALARLEETDKLELTDLMSRAALERLRDQTAADRRKKRE